MFILAVERVEIFGRFVTMNKRAVLANKYEKVINKKSVDNFISNCKAMVCDRNKAVFTFL